MNHSMYGADRTTHLKIVVVGLFAAMVVAGLALSSHISANAGTQMAVKADKPVVMTSAAVTLTR